MTTIPTDLCAVYYGTDEDDTISVNGHDVNTHEYLQVKRLNYMLAQEIGLLMRVTALRQEEALLLVAKTCVTQLLRRIPRDRVETTLRETYCKFIDYNAYYSSTPHLALGRTTLDTSFPIGLSMGATPHQFVMTNIVAKVLRDDDLLDDLWLLLSESLTAHLVLSMIRPVEEVLLMCGLPPEEVKEDNVVQFGAVSIDESFDPFAH
ncbi:hypothetical protein RB2150_17584 [Rhodobacterales bacterium HTCC2150]|nr:hypothetical protein RB2150_17584 [Rhodobacterales bacterium HTCC2150] [Rhodobacteraceae bacterium HTCC2150]